MPRCSALSANCSVSARFAAAQVQQDGRGGGQPGGDVGQVGRRDPGGGDLVGERPHQIARVRDDVAVRAADLLSVRRTAGAPTPEGVRADVAVALRYFDAWQRGQGAVALGGPMEDAATAGIARVQIWQWLRHGSADRAGVVALLDEECDALARERPDALVAQARAVFERTPLARQLPDFFTTDAYARHLVRHVGE